MRPQALYDAQGIERCRLCTEETHKLLTAERQVLESRIQVLAKESAYLESFINVLELQASRPPSRTLTLPDEATRMRARLTAALKAQQQLVNIILHHYMIIQMELVSGGVMAMGQWKYSANHDTHAAYLTQLQ